MKSYGMAYRCSGVKLALICLLLFGFSPAASAVDYSRDIHPELSEDLKKKLRWLDDFGTPIRVGPPTNPRGRRTEVACRKGKIDLVRKNWGLDKQKRNEELVPCPDFF